MKKNLWVKIVAFLALLWIALSVIGVWISFILAPDPVETYGDADQAKYDELIKQLQEDWLNVTSEDVQKAVNEAE